MSVFGHWWYNFINKKKILELFLLFGVIVSAEFNDADGCVPYILSIYFFILLMM